MDMESEASTNIWLEKHDIHVKPTKDSYSLKKLSLHKNTLACIKKATKTKKITWEEIINAAWGLLLTRLSSTDLICYGIADAYAQSKKIFIATSLKPMRTEIDALLTVKEFLKKVKSQLKSQNVKDKSDAEIRYLLLFKTLLKSKQSFEKINALKFPLILLTDKKKINSLEFYFQNEILNEKNIKFIFEHLELVLAEICQYFSEKVCKLNILTNKEKKVILTQWSHPKYDYKLPDLKLCFHELFAKAASNNPDNLALQHNKEEMTYHELDQQSSQFAAILTQNGIKTGDKVCVIMDRSNSFIVAMIAIFKCGAVFVPINPKYPEERIEFVLEDSQSIIAITDRIEKLPIKHKNKAFLFNNKLLNETTEKFHLKKTDPEQIAYIIYTSGTTGMPKGVMIRHKSLINFIAWYQACFNVREIDRSSQFASQGFDTYFCETIPFLAIGASVHIVDDSIKLTPSLFFEWVKNNKITICDLPTSYTKVLFLLPWPENLSLRILKIGGESVTQYPKQRFTFDIWNGYGPTEATIEETYYKIYSANSPPIKRKDAPFIGKPIANSEVFVVDKYLLPVPVGIAGELLIGGVSVAAGYLNRDDLNNTKFINATIDGELHKHLYRTGDLVRWNDDGNLEFIGRVDNQVKIRGYRVELGEIEQVISQHPDVKEVVVVAREGINKEKKMIAYVVPNLNKERFLYQQRCLLSTDKESFVETLTEDISKYGVALSGVPDDINVGQSVIIHLQLPGFNDSRSFKCIVIWHLNDRCGLLFDLLEEEQKIVSKSIDYYISTHNVMELVLSNAAKRSLKKALRNKLPEYMVPSTFVKLLELPLTFSGKIDVKSLPPPDTFEQLLQKNFIEAKTSTEKKISKIWKEILHKESVSMSDNFFDIGGSSLSAAELSIRILKEFDITIPVKLLFDLSFIPILAEYIDTKGKKYTTQSGIQEEISRDSKLHENILPVDTLEGKSLKPEHILLTGAGGFLGIYLLQQLLEQTDAKIYCLIRKGEFESAAKRLTSNILKFGLQDKISLSNRRIIIIPSDISLDNFGIPLEQYNNLLEKIDLIYHCGAQVNIMASYNKLRGSNVQGTIEIIKFATRLKDKPIHYISTLSSAYRKDENGSLTEEFPIETYDELFGGYAISKWVSERLLTQIKDRGLPSVLYRSGYIFGQSDNGITSLNDALLMLIKGCIQLGYAPNMEEKITILPVDFVSQIVVAISLDAPTTSQVYHVDHPTGILWSDLISWLNDYGYRIKIIPMKEWKHHLTSITHENALFPFLPYYLSLGDEQTSPNVNIENAKSSLEKLGIKYPDIDDKLLNIYFDYLCQINFLPEPAIDSSKSTIETDIP